MGVEVEVQYACSHSEVPCRQDFVIWIRAALVEYSESTEVVIRIVDEQESARLNAAYRRVPGPTNVLSFPFESPPSLDVPLLGDLAICAPVVVREARLQGKPVLSHWAHMVVHGVLHLLGYDHQNEEDAKQMEALETQILSGLGYPDPYKESEIG